MRASLLIAVLAAFPYAAQAQTSLTREQTSAWIIKNLADSAGQQAESYAHEYKDVAIDGCVLTFRDKTYSGPGTSEVQVKLPLVSVTKVLERSQLSNRTQEYSLNVTTSGQSIEQVRLNPDGSNAPATHGDFLKILFQRPDVNNADAAHRMADAINHMIELCGPAAPVAK